MPADAVFTLKVNQFKPYNKGDCPYEIIPPENSTEVFKPEDKAGHYPTWICGNGVELHVGHYQKPFTFEHQKRIPTTIRMTRQHAVLEFVIVGPDGKEGTYYPLGMGFFRADKTEPMGSPYTTSARGIPLEINGTKVESPFSKLQINDPPGTIRFDVERISKLHSKGIIEHVSRIGRPGEKAKNEPIGSHRTYALIVCVQDLKTGQMGVFDSPELEPPV
jgi:hypothetical protein